MKTKTSASIYLLILALIVGVILAAPLNAATVKADVEIDPDRVDLGAEAPGKFRFTLTFSGKYKNYKVADINRSTVLIEGIISPVPGKGQAKGLWKIDEETNTVTFKVNGEHLVDYVIWPKIYHMARVDPNPDQGTWFPYNIDITVTGTFNDGTSFTGSDRIKAYAPQGTVYPDLNSPP